VTKTRARRGPTPKLQQQLARIAQLPKAQQRFVIQLLEGLLNQHQQAA